MAVTMIKLQDGRDELLQDVSFFSSTKYVSDTIYVERISVYE